MSGPRSAVDGLGASSARVLSLGDVCREQGRSWPRELAVVDGETAFTFAELDERVDRLAGALSAAGVERASRVLWLGQNSFRVLETLLACARIGAIFCPVNWRQSTPELAFVLEDVEPQVVVWQEEELGEAIRELRGEHADDAWWIQHDGEGPDGYEQVVASAPLGRELPEVDATAPLLLLYTAAFEGRPNGALISHEAVLVSDLLLASQQRIDADFTYLNCGPLFHVFTLMFTLATFHAGGCNVFTPRADPEEVCRLVERHRCNAGFILGPTVDRIVELNADGDYDLSSLRVAHGRPEWLAMTSRDESPWGRRPAGYGQTEVMGIATFSAFGGVGSHGRPSPMLQLRLVDPATGSEVADGEPGEICVRGPTTPIGYHRRPELNAARLADGWWHTNDLGLRESDGSVTFIGPRTRMIKSAGENIYPVEVEAALRKHDAVADCAVIGVPDPDWAQRVKAVVVPAEGSSPTLDALATHCQELIASYKKPRHLALVDSLPRTATGTIDRDALDEQHGGGGYPGG